MNLYEVDLRWGITEEEGLHGKQIQLCLDEVDRCRPFFIGMLGQRYGWAPEEYEVPFPLLLPLPFPSSLLPIL